MTETPGYLKNLKKESVVQSVINCLTDAMRSKELKPGDRIPPEPDLAATLGVARSSVREAIKILTYLGVLESKRSEGTFVCDGFKESMIDPMIYGIILNQDSFENLMELREMTETGIMRLAVMKYDETEGYALEKLLERMKAVMEGGEDMVERFFQIDNEFHDMISLMGKNPLADKISRVVRTLTHAMRYETVATMINSGRGAELVAAHSKLYETLKSGDLSNVREIVRESYFGESLYGEGEASASSLRYE
ncbi:MAG: FCD domain-containing protein [Oscillospiraceae bacterium]|nr:FCD domain-containing protein [Oscillospiraceae bacterium]